MKTNVWKIENTRRFLAQLKSLKHVEYNNLLPSTLKFLLLSCSKFTFQRWSSTLKGMYKIQHFFLKTRGEGGYLKAPFSTNVLI